MKETVISVHGINTDGAWQEQLRPVIAPHFEYHPYKYRHYRTFGVCRLLLGPYWWACACVAATCAVTARVLHVWSVLIGSTVLLAGIIHAVRWRGNCISEFVNFVGDKAVNRPPHIIAHSLGSFLTGKALMAYEAFVTGNLILVGAVLRKRYNWQGLQARNQTKFQRVRNEIACRDIVARAASLAYGLIPPMGQAGFSGFAGQSGFVHELLSPWEGCPACEARVHNIRNTELGHSNLVGVVRIQARNFWLPFLWNIQAKGYSEFLALCAEIEAHWQGSDKENVVKARVKLLRSEWDWTDGALRSFIKRQIRLRRKINGLRVLEFPEMEFRVHRAILLVASLTVEAATASMLPEADGTERALEWLHPRAAVLNAVEAVFS